MDIIDTLDVKMWISCGYFAVEFDGVIKNQNQAD